MFSILMIGLIGAFAVLPVSAQGTREITRVAGQYSVKIEHRPESLVAVVFDGPEGKKNWIYRLDLLGDAALSDRGVLAFTAELTSDPVFQVVRYSGEGCDPCREEMRFDDPSNKTGAGYLPFRTGDTFGSASPFQWLKMGDRSHVPTLVGWDGACGLMGILHASWGRWSGEIPVSIPHVWSLRDDRLGPCNPDGAQDRGEDKRIVRARVISSIVPSDR